MNLPVPNLSDWFVAHVSRETRMKRKTILNVVMVAVLWGGFCAGLTGGTALGQVLTSKEKGREPAMSAALSPEEAQKMFRVPEGFEVRLFAAEPDVINPVSMAWDDRGRLWVVELYDYPYTTKEGAKNRDRVKVLEDTDGDGRADKVTVFADGLNLATAVQIGNGGVYVGAAPDLWFMKDTNGDDVADEKKVILTGFGLEDRHELLNNLTWGPDGWMYFTHGVFTSSKVTDPDHPERPPVKFNAGVLRFNPSDKRLELFGDGISNQWGLDWDRYGNVFVSACVVEHLWHVAPGGVYVRQGGVPGWPYAYDLLKHINDHKHFRAAYSGVQVYQGGAWPKEYDGTILMGNIHGNCINQDQLVASGSSFVAKDLHKGKDHVDDAFLNTTDGWFRPVNTQVGPDGNIWIADWYDKYPCYQNSRQPDLDRERGRIWRVVYVGNEKGKKVPPRPEGLDLQKLNDVQLVDTLKDPNVWMRRHAQRILSERKTAAAPLLMPMVQTRNQALEARMAALWTLYSTGNLNLERMHKLAADPEPAIRMWIARFAGEMEGAGNDQLSLVRLLATDKSPSVRAAVAESARRLAALETVPLIEILLDQEGTNEDSMLPELIWYALEPKLAGSAQALFDFYASDLSALKASGPLVPRSIARRLYSSGDDKLVASLLSFIESNKDKPIAAVMLDGIIAGHKSFMTPPANSEAIAASLAKSADRDVVAKSKQLSTQWGSKASVETALKLLGDAKAAENERLAAAKLLAGNKSDAVRKALLKVIGESASEPQLKIQALRGLGEFGVEADGSAILGQWAHLPGAEVRRAACETLSARPAWAKSLLMAVKEKKVEAADIPLPALRTLAAQAAKDADLKTLMAATVGAYRESPADKQKLIESKKSIVMNGPVNKERGHALFVQHCAVCHQLNGEGANPPVGPDITGVGRGTLDLLLNNVIDPDQIIGVGYENIIVDTNDGDTKSGRLVEETPQYIKLLSAGPKEEVIQKTQIKERRVSPKSVMPEGFDQVLKDDEFRDLMRFVLEAPVGR